MTVITGIDVETTGLEQNKGDRIIEIAMISVEVTGENYRPIYRYVQRIDPLRSIDPGAEAVHHININDLRGCPTWDKVGPDVQKALERTGTLVAHNMDFDGPFVGGELLRIGVTPPPTLQTFC